MELEQYINQEREIYNSILKFIESEENIEEKYRKLIDLFNKGQILDKRSEIIEALQILTSISSNHHRIGNFYSKVERILDYFLDQLKQNFSNTELLQIFHQDKRIIYYLMTKDIFQQDETYLLLLLKNPFNFYEKHEISRKLYIKKSYDFYFYPEIKKHIQSIEFDWYDRDRYRDIESSDLTDFEKKRENGENDNYICSLIRNDSITEFITYVNKMNYSLSSSSINSSIFETNSFLLPIHPTLIEYAAFYGSIQIYQYLRMNKVDLSPKLWLFAIHGNNPDIIHLLEEDNIKPENDSYYNCFLESVKCHHNSIAKYIKDNFLNEKDESVLEIALQYHNYEMFPNDFNNFDILFNACKFNCISIVKILMNNNKEDINKTIKVKPDEILTENNNLNEILNKIYFFNRPLIYFAAKENYQEIINILMSQKELKLLPYSFIECTQITKITIPSHMTKIGNSAFEYCYSLNEVNFANDSKLLFISNYAFMGCNKLQQITIPPSVRLIGYSAFFECNSLKEITIPPSVLLIGSCAFAYCSSLKQISYSSETKILDDAFLDCSLESNNSFEITKSNEFENSLRAFISEITTNEKINHFENISEDEIFNELLNIFNQHSNKENANTEDYKYYQNEICHDLTEIFYNPSFSITIISVIGESKCIQVKNTETVDSLNEKVYNWIHSNYSALEYNGRLLFRGTKIRNYGLKKGSIIYIGIK